MKAKPKQRISASIDAGLLEAAEGAVASGAADNLSAWVSDAIRLKLEHDRRLQALSEFVQAYEAEHGEITEDELKLAARRARARAIPVRALAPRKVRKARGQR